MRSVIHICWGCASRLSGLVLVLVQRCPLIIMYIYSALINALSAYIIHVNLNMIFYTNVEHSPTKTIYIKYYTEKQTNMLHTRAHTHTHTHRQTAIQMCTTQICIIHQTCAHARPHLHAQTHTHNDCSRNCLLILVWTEIL